MLHFQNGTWYHLDVHAKPHFVQKPDDIVYVSIRDQVILVCQVRKQYIFFEPIKLVDIRFALHPYIYVYIYAAQRKLKLAKFALSILPAHVMLYGWIW